MFDTYLRPICLYQLPSQFFIYGFPWPAVLHCIVHIPRIARGKVLLWYKSSLPQTELENNPFPILPIPLPAIDWVDQTLDARPSFSRFETNLVTRMASQTLF